MNQYLKLLTLLTLLCYSQAQQAFSASVFIAENKNLIVTTAAITIIGGFIILCKKIKNLEQIQHDFNYNIATSTNNLQNALDTTTNNLRNDINGISSRQDVIDQYPDLKATLRNAEKIKQQEVQLQRDADKRKSKNKRRR